MKGQITDIEGIRVGYRSDREAITGRAVLLCEESAVGGVEIRGSASGTRGLDARYPLQLTVPTLSFRRLRQQSTGSWNPL